MAILVTGGAGYIGSHTTRLLQERGYDVWVYDNLEHGHARAVPTERLIVGDLGDTDTLEVLLGDRRIGAVIHFAAYARVDESVRDPGAYYRNNLVHTLGLLESMRRTGVKRMVLSSTCATYGIPARVPITEVAPQQPINPYGRTKLAVEWAMADYAAAYGFELAALR